MRDKDGVTGSGHRCEEKGGVMGDCCFSALAAFAVSPSKVGNPGEAEGRAKRMGLPWHSLRLRGSVREEQSAPNLEIEESTALPSDHGRNKMAPGN